MLTRIPVRLAQFQAGKWGDPRSSSVAGPTLVQKKAVRLKKGPGGTVLVLTQLTIPSQAHLYASVFAKGSTRLSILKHGSRLGPWLTGKASKTAQTLILKRGRRSGADAAERRRRSRRARSTACESPRSTRGAAARR